MKQFLLLTLLSTFLFSADEYAKNIIACEENNTTACVKLGLAYSLGFTPEKKMDGKKSIHYYKKACTLNDMEGCLQLGITYQHGLLIDRDVRKAKEYYAKACIMGTDIAPCKFYKELSK